PRVLRQRRNADSRSSRRILREVGRINFIHLLEIAEVGQEHGGLDDVGERQAFGFQDRNHVIEHAPGLLRDLFGNNLPAFRIERHLACAKNERAGPDGLRVRPDRRRRVGGGNDLLHPASLAGKSPHTMKWSRHGPRRAVAPTSPPRRSCRYGQSARRLRWACHPSLVVSVGNPSILLLHHGWLGSKENTWVE